MDRCCCKKVEFGSWASLDLAAIRSIPCSYLVLYGRGFDREAAFAWLLAQLVLAGSQLRGGTGRTLIFSPIFYPWISGSLTVAVSTMVLASIRGLQPLGFSNSISSLLFLPPGVPVTSCCCWCSDCFTVLWLAPQLFHDLFSKFLCIASPPLKNINLSSSSTLSVERHRKKKDIYFLMIMTRWPQIL
jgi:hypothetical protein